jgi:uncharacterized coiled-coil DUF342 family protein
MKYKLDPKIVEQYALKYGTSIEDAEKRLSRQYKIEQTTIPTRELSIKCIQSIREIAPKINGLEQRDLEYQKKFNYFQQHIQTLTDNIRELEISIELLSKQKKSIKTRLIEKIKKWFIK